MSVGSRVASYEQRSSSHVESSGGGGYTALRSTKNYSDLSNGGTMIAASKLNGGAEYSAGNYSSYSSTGGYGGGKMIVGGDSLVYAKSGYYWGLSSEDEQKFFAGLNNRLAKYIEVVRSLNLSKEDFLSAIRAEMGSHTQVSYHSVQEEVAAVYRSEMSGLRAEIEALKTEKARISVDLQNEVLEERRKWSVKIDTLQSQISAREMRIQEFDGQIHALTNGFNNDLAMLRQQLKQASVDRAHWESECNRVSHELAIATESHRKIMSGYQSHHQIDVEAIYAKMKARNDLLQHELDTLRADFDARLRVELFQRDIKIDFTSGIKLDVEQYVQEIGVARKQAEHYRFQMDELKGRIGAYEREIAELRARYERHITELQTMTTTVDTSHLQTSVAQIEAQLAEKFRAEHMKLEAQYRAFDIIKRKFETELGMYDKLLEGEEKRLHIYSTFVHKKTGRSFVSKGHSDIDVVIDEICMDGSYIHLTNKGGTAFNLASYAIRSEAGGIKKKFKFHSNEMLTLMPGKAMTIWSPGHGTHNPPDSIVMKSIEWPKGEKIYVELLDQNETRVAHLKSWYDVDSDDEYAMGNSSSMAYHKSTTRIS